MRVDLKEKRKFKYLEDPSKTMDLDSDKLSEYDASIIQYARQLKYQHENNNTNETAHHTDDEYLEIASKYISIYRMHGAVMAKRANSTKNPVPDAKYRQYSYLEILQMANNGVHIPKEVLFWAKAQEESDVTTYEVISDSVMLDDNSSTLESTQDSDINSLRTTAMENLAKSVQQMKKNEVQQKEAEELTEKAKIIEQQSKNLVGNAQENQTKFKTFRLNELIQKNKNKELTDSERSEYSKLQQDLDSNGAIRKDIQIRNEELERFLDSIDTLNLNLADSEKISQETIKSGQEFAKLDEQYSATINKTHNANALRFDSPGILANTLADMSFEIAPDIAVIKGHDLDNVVSDIERFLSSDSTADFANSYIEQTNDITDSVETNIKNLEISNNEENEEIQEEIPDESIQEEEIQPEIFQQEISEPENIEQNQQDPEIFEQFVETPEENNELLETENDLTLQENTSQTQDITPETESVTEFVQTEIFGADETSESIDTNLSEENTTEQLTPVITTETTAEKETISETSEQIVNVNKPQQQNELHDNELKFGRIERENLVNHEEQEELNEFAESEEAKTETIFEQSEFATQDTNKEVKNTQAELQTLKTTANWAAQNVGKKVDNDYTLNKTQQQAAIEADAADVTQQLALTKPVDNGDDEKNKNLSVRTTELKDKSKDLLKQSQTLNDVLYDQVVEFEPKIQLNTPPSSDEEVIFQEFEETEEEKEESSKVLDETNARADNQQNEIVEVHDPTRPDTNATLVASVATFANTKPDTDDDSKAERRLTRFNHDSSITSRKKHKKVVAVAQTTSNSKQKK